MIRIREPLLQLLHALILSQDCDVPTKVELFQLRQVVRAGALFFVPDMLNRLLEESLG